jgi:hypothetical protein
MHAEFTEATYAFSVVGELMTGGFGVTAVPAFPSQWSEGREGGFDVEVPFVAGSVFLQFKLSEWMVRTSAQQWNLFHQEYFRFWLHSPTRSKQHQLLLDLEGTPADVYYAAPAFRESAELNDHYFGGRVCDNSIAVPPIEIGPLPDTLDHCVCFRTAAGVRFFSSDPEGARRMRGGRSLQEVLMSVAMTERIDETYFARLHEVLLQILREHRVSVALTSAMSDRRLVASLLRAHFGCELMFVVETAEG